MAAKYGKERVVSALKSLSSDGLLLPVNDHENFQVFIEEYFDESGDNSRSEDDEVSFLSTSFIV